MALAMVSMGITGIMWWEMEQPEEAWQQPTAAVSLDATPLWQDYEGCGSSDFLFRLSWCPGRGVACVLVMWG